LEVDQRGFGTLLAAQPHGAAQASQQEEDQKAALLCRRTGFLQSWGAAVDDDCITGRTRGYPDALKSLRKDIEPRLPIRGKGLAGHNS
jgi:hypothetical protein